MATTFESTTNTPLKLDNKLQSSSTTFEPFNLPAGNQRILGAPHNNQTVIPLALRPSSDDKDRLTLESVVESIKNLQSQDGLLTKLLARHGTLLFRGLPITDAESFSRFAHAFGYKPHEIIGIVITRPMLAANVAPANESPKGVLIYNHNESPQVPHAPEYVFLYGKKAPLKGGETPISSSLELFHRAKAEMPEFIDELAQKGILSTVSYKFKQQYPGGSTIRQAFGKEVEDGDSEEVQRQKMETQIRRYGRGKNTTWEWTEDGVTLYHKLPAIRTQPGTNLPTLFTALAAYFRNRQHNGDSARMKFMTQKYGDGTPIPEKYLAHLANITDEIRVLHKWQDADVLVYDNIIAQHGREPWEGEQEDRVVLASLFDSIVPGAYSNADFAQVVQALDTADV